MAELKESRVLHLKVSLGSFVSFIDKICAWALEKSEILDNSGNILPNKRSGKYVCVAPVAACMEAFWNTEFRRICQEADLVSPDGTPIVWALRHLGHSKQQRISGPDLMAALCREAAAQNIPIGLYGGTQLGLGLLQQNLQQQYPELNISYAYSPPFRSVGEAESAEILEAIRQSGAKLLFVGIGCPKQEIWMAKYKDQLPLVMLGVGAAFLYHSVELRRAPVWVQNCGFEWLFRLLQEPKRLFKRYLKTNLAFLWHTHLLSARKLRKYLPENTVH